MEIDGEDGSKDLPHREASFLLFTKFTEEVYAMFL